MNYELKALACLLIYPRDELKADLGDISEAILNSKSLGCDIKNSLKTVIMAFSKLPLREWQEKYVRTFDMGKHASLNLFEHLHADSRERGPAMNNLLKLYDDHGLKFESSELPDYLPAVLEFLSGLSAEEAKVWLESAAPLIDAIHAELLRTKNPWTPVLGALLDYAGVQPSKPENEDEPVPPFPECEYFDKPVTFANSNDPLAQTIRFVKNERKIQ